MMMKERTKQTNILADYFLAIPFVSFIRIHYEIICFGHYCTDPKSKIVILRRYHRLLFSFARTLHDRKNGLLLKDFLHLNCDIFSTCTKLCQLYAIYCFAVFLFQKIIALFILWYEIFVRIVYLRHCWSRNEKKGGKVKMFS